MRSALHNAKMHCRLHGILFLNYNVPIMNEGNGSFSSPEFSIDNQKRF